MTAWERFFDHFTDDERIVVAELVTWMREIGAVAEVETLAAMSPRDLALLLGERMGAIGFVDEREVVALAERFVTAARAGGIVLDVRDLRGARNDGKAKLIVRGVVRRPVGLQSSIVARAFDRELRRERALGEHECDSEGRYEIDYQIGGADRPNLVVRAYARASGDLLAESETRFDAQQIEVIDLTIAPSGSEFERVRAAVSAVASGVRMVELSVEDVAFIAGKAKLETTSVARLVAAERVAAGAKVAPDVLYALAAAGMAADLDGLWKHSPAEIRSALHRASAERVVPARDADAWERAVSELETRIVDHVTGAIVACAGEELAAAGLAEHAHEDVVRRALCARREGVSADWRELGGRFGLRVEAIEHVRFAIEASDVCGRSREALAALVERRARGEIESALELAAAKLVERHAVTGSVTTPLGRPVVGAIAQAWHRGLANDVPLSAPAMTDARGRYRLLIDPETLALRVGGATLHLHVRLAEATGGPEVGRSEVTFDAVLPATIDIRTTRQIGPSEWEIVESKARGVLGGVDPAQLDGKHVWLAGAIGVDRDTARRFVEAHRRAQLSPQLPAEVHYAALHPAVRGITGVIGAAIEAGITGEGARVHGEALDAWRRARAVETAAARLRAPADAGRAASIGDVLRAARVSERAIESYTAIVAAEPMAGPEVIAARFGSAGIAKEDQAALHRAQRIAGIVGGKPELVARVLAELPASSDAEIDECALATMARKPGGDEVAAALARAFPRDAMIGRLGAKRELASVAEFLDRNPSFDLHGKSVPFQLRGAGVPQRLADELASLQRLSRIAATDDAVALLGAGFRSARAIAAMPVARFADALVKSHADRNDVAAIRDRAASIHRTAIRHANAALAIATGLAPELRIDAAIGGELVSDSGTDAKADLTYLFGSQDARLIAPCESVLGLGAYFVDLLDQLDASPTTDGARTALDVLFDRRGDLADIVISCASSETPVPYIDLVIELLENIVHARPAGTPAPQTTWSARELAAYPERLDAEAYTQLASAVYPWSLPFSLPELEATTYLADLGVSRDELLATVHPEADLTRARLGLTEIEHRIITAGIVHAEARLLFDAPAITPAGVTFPPKIDGVTPDEGDIVVTRLIGNHALALWQKRGGAWVELRVVAPGGIVVVRDGASHAGEVLVRRLPPANVIGAKLSVAYRAGAFDFSSSVAGSWAYWGHTSEPADWPAREGRSARAFCDHTGIDHAELVELLRAHYVDPTHAVTLVPAPDAEAHDLSRTRLVGIDSAFLARFHRFVRLRRKLGVSIRDLDRALAVFRAPDITDRFLVDLAATRKISDRLKLPLVTVLAFYGDVDIESEWDRRRAPAVRRPSQYEVLFGDKMRLSDRDRATLALPIAGTLGDVAAAGCAALRLASSDYTLLEVDSSTPALAGLSMLVRWQALANALGVSITELRRLRDLTGLEPFVDPAGTLGFLDAAELVRGGPIGALDLAAVLHHAMDATAEAAFDTRAAARLSAVKRAFPKSNDVLAAILPAEIDPAPIAELLAGTGICTNLASADLDHEPAIRAGTVRTLGAVRATLAPLAAALGCDLAPLVEELCRAGGEAATPGANRTAVVLDPATAIIAEPAIVKALARDLQIRDDVVGALLAAIPAPVRFATRAAAATVALVTGVRDDLVDVRTTIAWPVAVRLAKAAVITTRLGLTASEVPRALSSLGELPERAGASDVRARFARWHELDALVTVRDRLAGRGASLWTLRGLGSWADVVRALGSEVDVTVLALADAPGQASARSWARLLDALDLAARLGVSVDTLARWVGPVDLATAGEIRTAAASLHDGSAWERIAPLLRARVRDAQRTALVGHVVAMLRLPSVDALRDRMLVDVEMGPEVTTTRIGFAVAAVQRFVRRALLGAEASGLGEDGLSDAFEAAWPWLESYRSWRRAREVFFYPESALGPELRRDKSPFFVELEQALAQRDLTDDNVEAAIGAYLQRLDEVGHMEMMGTCIEEARLHIVARTRGTPHDYYHRTWDLETHEFSGWEKLDLHIDGDWVVPIVLDKRLRLYWIRHAKQIEPMSDMLGFASSRPFPLVPHAPVFQDDYTLSWSTKGRTGWTPKRTAKHGIARPFFPFSTAQFSVRVIEDEKNAQPALLRIGGVTVLPAPSPPPPPPPPPTIAKPQVQFSLADLNPFGGNGGGKGGGGGGFDFTAVITKLGELESTISGLPERIFPTDIANTLWSFVRWVQQLVDEPSKAIAAAGLQVSVGAGSAIYALGKRLEAAIDELATAFTHWRPTHPGFEGVVPGLEFGLFELGDADARAHRLTLPAPEPLLMMSDPRFGVPVWLAYSLFPGYPGLFDVPVLTEQVSADLSLLPETITGDDTIGYWPGNGYFLSPAALDDMFGMHATVALDFSTIQNNAEERGDLGPLEGVMRALQQGAAIADELKSAAVGELTANRMRVVRPARMAAFPGRAGAPPPTILTDERRARSYLLWREVAPPRPHDVSWPVWRVSGLYHPLSSQLSRAFGQDGVRGLYQLGARPGPAWDIRPSKFDESFTVAVAGENDASAFVKGDDAVETLDVTHGGAYALYNWELFFHLPVLLAARFATHRRFDAAIAWLRNVFDPASTRGDGPARFWGFKAFNDEFAAGAPELKQSIGSWLAELVGGTPATDEPARRERTFTAWMRDPFDAHRIARLRPGVYERAVVMQTVDTLIAWADARFAENTWESINDATQLYLHARDILGPRPALVPIEGPRRRSYRELRDVDAFGNALLAIEASLPAGADDGDPAASLVALGGRSMLYFGVPVNEAWLERWNVVDRRLHNIRHGLGLRGLRRTTLPPGSGTSVTLVDEMRLLSPDPETPPAVTLPPYRFSVMAQKANELANDVKALGGALLSALEKRDGEVLARLRQTHEIELLDAMTRVKVQQVEEARASLAAAEQSKTSAQLRYDYYTRLSAEYMNPAEIVKEVLGFVGQGLQVAAGIGELAAAAVHLIPQGTASGGVDTSGKATYGGSNLGEAAAAGSRALATIASVATFGSAMAGTHATYVRRQEEWNHQAELAANELEQVDRQIEAARTRVAITSDELANHRLQITRSRELDALMREKFTNQQLYDWTAAQLAQLHFQSYLLAVDRARRAEACYRFECVSEQRYIEVEQWPGLESGLTAGERLQYALRTMETAYMDANPRERELTKHVSLRQIAPLALIQLRETGTCQVSFSESLFDGDHPGHFQRRIRAIAVSIPCVAGPYTNVNCRLAISGARFRKTADATGVYPEAATRDDPRFAYGYAPAVQTIATSTGQSDSGTFETNLHDERYLPFEGAGAISEWTIDLPKDTNRFDFKTISDVILHVRYTAREGGADLRSAAAAAVRPRAGIQLISVRRDFADDWHRFVAHAAGTVERTLDLGIDRDRFPYADGSLATTRVDVLVKTTHDVALAFGPSGAAAPLPLAAVPDLDGVLQGSVPGTWPIARTRFALTFSGALPADAIEDVFLLWSFEVG